MSRDYLGQGYLTNSIGWGGSYYKSWFGYNLSK